ncbi:hypothetical protein VKT23_019289 [Stygiomarasmius scandens]|uniref:Extracellular membrane protein CFEM domain-containing protein n=1 Tax=Marasmiellus scandens TaxID=2682957 RepID=A0ABR1ING9_9AGAR
MYKISSTSLFTVALASLSVSGAAVDFAHPFRQLLVARQSGDVIDPSIIPPQCQNECDSIVTTINACDASDVDCGCTNQDFSDFAGCLNCFISLEPSLAPVLQDNLDEVRDACESVGVDLPPTTLSGGSGGGGISASATGAASITSSRASGGSNGFTEFSSGSARPTETETSARTTSSPTNPSGDDDDNDGSGSSSSGDNDSNDDDNGGLSTGGDNGAALALRGNSFLLALAGIAFGAFMML